MCTAGRLAHRHPVDIKIEISTNTDPNINHCELF